MKERRKMNLTDNDKREIIQLIQENKPLPDKYRFLMFRGREEIELLWNGKDDAISNISLPFQTIEHVDEPRAEKEIKLQGNLFDESGRQLGGTNKLIWGDNKLILSSLYNGYIYEEIKKLGGLKLVYIDPPFNVDDDFKFEIKVGDDNHQVNKERNILEEIAYRDTWGKGADSFLSMIYERIHLIHRLLADEGNLYLHCGIQVNNILRTVLDEVFGAENFVTEIIWNYGTASGGRAAGTKAVKTHEYILHYAKNYKNRIENKTYLPYSEKYINDWFKYEDEDGRKYQKRFRKTGVEKQYLDESKGVPLSTVWTDIKQVYADPRAYKKSQAEYSEITGYPTQKPEELLERIIQHSSNEEDLIGDFFCGSGTTLAVAEKLNRRWIGSDLGKFAIHTARKRLISVQRQLKGNGKNYRAFEILNLGKYQRESFLSSNNNLSDKNKEQHFISLILKAYEAEKIENPVLHGIKNNRYVYIGPINIHVSRKAVETVVKECIKNSITKVDILCFEHEQGLFPNIINEAKEKGVDVTCKIIPPSVFDKRAIERKQVVFHDVAYIEFKPSIKKNKISVELTGFSVDYSQEKIDEVMTELKSNKSKVLIQNGQIIKISRDKNGIEKKELITKSWKDWIDYWAVDFDFENKKEIYREKNEDGKFIEKWSGDFIFENEWQSFRNFANNMEYKSAEKPIRKKTMKVAVKVVDIFGNDTMKVIKVNT